MNGLQNSIIKKYVKPIKYSINNLYTTPDYTPNEDHRKHIV